MLAEICALGFVRAITFLFWLSAVFGFYASGAAKGCAIQRDAIKAVGNIFDWLYVYVSDLTRSFYVLIFWSHQSDIRLCK